MTFQILYEDTHLVVLSKPAGLLSQGDSSGTPSLVDLLRTHFGRHYVGLVHRLDRNTSGLMVVAKRSKSADRLSECLKDGRLDRAYLAVVHGKMIAAEEWTDFLLKDVRTNEVSVVEPNTRDAKPASLRCEPLASKTAGSQAVSLVLLKLKTGRSHQIRVQAASREHSVVGDVKYGKPGAIPSAPRPLLHSAFLKFEHPMSHETMVFTDPPPGDFETLWGQMPEISAINPFK